MATLIEGLILMIGLHIQEKQKTEIYESISRGRGGGGGEAFQSSTTPPLGSDPAMTCKF